MTIPPPPRPPPLPTKKNNNNNNTPKKTEYSVIFISAFIGDGVFLGSDEHLENARNVLWRSNVEEVYDPTRYTRDDDCIGCHM